MCVLSCTYSTIYYVIHIIFKSSVHMGVLSPTEFALMLGCIMGSKYMGECLEECAYQGPSKHRWQHRTINVVLKHRRICLPHYPSHPAWQYIAEGKRLTMNGKEASRSPGVCSTTLLNVEYDIEGISWQSSHEKNIYMFYIRACNAFNKFQ